MARPILLLLSLMLAAPLTVAGESPHLTAAAFADAGPPTPSGSLQWAVGCQKPPAPPLDVPTVVDECGDTMEGPLTMEADLVLAASNRIVFVGGALEAHPALTFGGDAVCLEGAPVPACGGIGLQSRVVDACDAWFAVREVRDDGTVACEGPLQARVTGTCPPGAAVHAIQPDGGVVCESGPGWRLGGNAGTSPGPHFVGTTDDQALEFKVANQRALRLEPTAGSPNVIGGSSRNHVVDGVIGATIGGGGSGSGENVVGAPFGTIGGGRNNVVQSFPAGETGVTVGGGVANLARGTGSTIAGGNGNRALFFYTTVGGGQENFASETAATVGGGRNNFANGQHGTVGGGGSNVAWVYATVAGGQNNQATESHSSVPGGLDNVADGSYGFAAGRQAKALHSGAFVWADSTAVDFTSTAVNEFSALATGGVRFVSALDAEGNPASGVSLAPGSGSWSSLSDVGAKRDLRAVDRQAVLEELARMPVYTWSYAAQPPDVLHMGPTAQDFAAAFGLGEDPTRVNVVDADGVSLAAIQALHDRVEDQERRIEQLEAELALLRGDGASLPP